MPDANILARTHEGIASCGAGERSHNLSVALALASAGISIFPCRGWLAGNDAKTPCRGVRWRHESTTETATITKWWARWPDAAPAIDVGKSNLLVIDCDPAKDEGQIPGDPWWCELLSQHEPIDIPVSNTPSGGRHYLFRQPGGEPLGNARGALPPKPKVAIDVRGQGGYIVAPGAVLSGDRAYVLEGAIAAAPVAPGWLVELLAPSAAEPASSASVTLPPAPIIAPSSDRTRAWAAAALNDEFREVASLPPGSRNEGLNKSAYKVGGLVGAGYITNAEAFETMSAAVVGWKDQPKTLDTLRRGLRDGAQAPRIMPPEEGHNGAALAALIMSGDGRHAVDSDGAVVDRETGEVIGTSEHARMLTVFDGLLGSIMSVPPNMPGSLRRQMGAPLYPPGLVGRLAHWINQTARRPLHSLAIGAALCIVGTAMGRRIGTPTQSGTHLYVVGLAPTGAGKDHPLDSCRTALHGSGLGSLRGGSEFMSMSAAINAISSKPLSLWPMDEFGAFLGRVNSRKASGFEQGISKILRSLWGSSFKLYSTPEWAGRQASDVHAPALSIFGVSTPSEFFAALGGADVTNGLLNRFLMLGAERAAERDPLVDRMAGVPSDIADGLRRLYGADDRGNLPPIHVGDVPPAEAIFLRWGPGARDVYEHLGRQIEAIEDASPADAAFYGRTAEMAVRIATIIAAGDGRDDVSGGDMLYGALLATESANAMLSAFHERAGVGEHGERVQNVEDEIRRAGTISRQRLTKRLCKKMDSRTLGTVLGQLVDAGIITAEMVVAASGRGRPGEVYRWAR